MAPKAINYGTYKQILNQASESTELPDEYYDEIPKDLRRSAFTVAGIAKMAVIASLLDSLETAEKNGTDFESWAASIDDEKFQSLNDFHKQTLYRTNMSVQYNGGRLQVGLTSDTLVYLKYQATLDDRTRPNHAACDGVTLPIDDTFWRTHTPPNGFGCRCFVLNIDAKDLQDNPLTPKSDITKAMTPDEGFSFSPIDPESEMTKIYRERAKALPPSIRAASLDRLMDKNKDQASWWKNAKKDFVKPD